jgi:hypothetical protein
VPYTGIGEEYMPGKEFLYKNIQKITESDKIANNVSAVYGVFTRRE